MKTFKLATLVFVTVVTSACVQSQYNQKQSHRHSLGAGAGALLGSQVGGGKGPGCCRHGALGGAFLGSEVGESLDEVDRLKAGEAQQALSKTTVQAR